MELPKLFRSHHIWWIALAILVLRFAELSNPLTDFDEQFYLYTGGKIAEGLIPFVDIFDRKPVGLFLLYAIPNFFGEHGILAYHLMALMFVFATSMSIYAMVIRVGAARATTNTAVTPENTRHMALLAALAYPIWLNVPGGAGGQAPVFYNLFVTLAAHMLIILIASKDMTMKQLATWGCAVMLLMGISIQIKYNSFFEGIYFGLFLLWMGWYRFGFKPLPWLAILWVATALLPTALALLAYLQMGHLDAFIFANFTSILERESDAIPVLITRFGIVVAIVFPLYLIAMPGYKKAFGNGFEDGPNIPLFVLLWAFSAFFAVVIFGTYYPHYSLATMTVGALAISLVSDAKPGWHKFAWILLALVAIGGQIGRYAHRAERGGWNTLNQLTGAIKDPQNCPFLFDQPPVLIHVGGYCAPTNYIFPGHLNWNVERVSVGVDVNEETKRILATNPQYVVRREKYDAGANQITYGILTETLTAKYKLIKSIERGESDIEVYKLNPEYTPLPNMVVPGRK